MNTIKPAQRRHILAAGVALALMAAFAIAVRAADDTPPANVAGAWQMTADTPQGTFTATLTIEQDGETIKGTQKSDYGEVPIAGTVKGNAIQFTVTVSSPNGSFTVTHDGTVAGDTMKGTLKVNDNTGTWSATRQAQKQ
ncbi:MAG: hypothetical protein WA871_11430 [Candidatus Acidiferrales bacterium]